MRWITNATHGAPAFTRWLMPVLGPVVHSCTGSDEGVFDVGDLGDLGLCGWIAP